MCVCVCGCLRRDMLPSSFAMSLIELIREQAGIIVRLVSLIIGLVGDTRSAK